MATKQEPIRRTDVIRCEKCGEDYSVTYKRCPFCDERPPRTRRVSGEAGGRRMAGGRRRRRRGVNPLQVIGVVGSLALIIAALYIVFTVVSPLLGLGDSSSSQSNPPSSSSTSVTPPASSTTQPDPSGSTTEPGTSSGTETPTEPDPAPEVVEPVAPAVTSITLNKSDITMAKNEKYKLKVTVDPTDAAVIWTSSDESVAKVAQDGTVYNVNTGSKRVSATITATAGDKTASCIVRCAGGSSALNFPSDYAPGTVPAVTPSTPTTPSTGTTTPTTPSTPSTGTTTPSTPSTGTAVNSTGVVTGAGSGLNVRTGPASSYSAIASLSNGSEVKVLEDTGTGWYKISFNGIGGKRTEGYASKNYISVR